MNMALRVLVCSDGVFGKEVQRSILARFPRLHTISINSHGDITRNEAGQFSYRDLFRELPSSLTHFEITHAHGPDLKVIETLKNCCPELRVLRLGRCTMFNTTPACEFWAGYPFDHDAYISIAGTDDYAVRSSLIVRPEFSLSACSTQWLRSLSRSKNLRA